MWPVCSKCSFRGRHAQQTGSTSSPGPSQPAIELTPRSAHDIDDTPQPTTQDEPSHSLPSPSSSSIAIPESPSVSSAASSNNPIPETQKAILASSSNIPLPKSRSTTSAASSNILIPEPPKAPSAGPSTLPLWDSNNPDQQEIVSRSARYHNILKHKLDDLTEYVQLPDMWATLRTLDVIDRRGKERILTKRTEMDQVEALVDHLQTGPVWRLHAFCRALTKTHQSHIINLIDLDPSEYEDAPTRGQTKVRKPHYYKRVESDEMIQISNDLLPGLLQHCGSYNQTLLKTSLFGFKREKPIDLTQLYVNSDASCRKNMREKIPVNKMQLFQQLFGTRCPNCLSLEGPGGAGKSSFLENYAHEWSKDVAACEEKGPNHECTGHQWKLVVLIPSGAMTGSAVDAIRQNLRCEPPLQGPMMSSVLEDGDGTLIIYDAMDELRNKKSIASISSYVQTSQKMVGKPKVLVSARNGLLSVPRSLFDRELFLEGFTVPQGIEYVERYFHTMYSFSDHPVIHHVKAHPEDLEWVLGNPLRVHIFSELTACGFLTLQDIKSLTTVKLFNSLDKLLLQRDEELRPTQRTDPDVFYQACLKCILTDTRTLSEEDVGQESPYVSFLQRHEYMGQDFNNYSSFTFPHEMLIEYFGMRGLVQCLKDNVAYKQAMLLYLCAEPKMRNFLVLTCAHIAQCEAELLPDLVFIIRAYLILQPERVWCEQNARTQELLQLPAVIQDTFPTNILSEGLTEEQTTKLDDATHLIDAMFTEKAQCLREDGWFLNGYGNFSEDEIIPNKGHHTLFMACMTELTHTQQLDVCSQTTHRMLPCTRYNMRLLVCHSGTVTVVPTNGVRWAAITSRETGGQYHVDLCLQSPCDLEPCLNSWSHTSSGQQILHQVQQRQLQQRLQQQQKQRGHKHPKNLLVLPCITYFVMFTERGHGLSLPTDPWSEDQWTPGVRELLSPHYGISEICVNMDDLRSQPLSGLLSACRSLITSTHELTLGLHIWNGKVREEELTAFCTWARQVQLRLYLLDLTVVLSAGCGKKGAKDVHSAIKSMVKVGVGSLEGGIRAPRYVTPGGEVLYTPDRSDSGCKCC